MEGSTSNTNVRATGRSPFSPLRDLALKLPVFWRRPRLTLLLVALCVIIGWKYACGLLPFPFAPEMFPGQWAIVASLCWLMSVILLQCSIVGFERMGVGRKANAATQALASNDSRFAGSRL